MAETFHIKQNDTSPSLAATLRDADNAVVDLSGARRLAAAKKAEEEAAHLAAAKKAEEDAARLAAAKKAEEAKWESFVQQGGYVFNQRNGSTYTFVRKEGIVITYSDDKGNIMSSSSDIVVSPIQPHYPILYNTPLINKKTSIAVLFKNYVIYGEKGDISKNPRILIETAMTKATYILDVDSILNNMINVPKEGEKFNCTNGHNMEVVKIEVDHENRVSLTFKVNGVLHRNFIHDIPCSFNSDIDL